MRQATSLDKKKSYKTILAIVGLAGGVLTVAINFHTVLSYFKPERVQENTEIVLDRSAAMNQEFENGTKLQAALASVEKVLLEQVADRDNLAFRLFGGTCDDDGTKLALNFHQNNAGQLRNLLHNIKADGQTGLARAVIDASSDFNDPERFKGVSKRIIVITSGDDSCLKDAVAAIRERFERSKRNGFEIQLDYRFIGVGVIPSEQQRLAEIAQITGGKVVFADHPHELDNVLHQLLVVEPVVNDVHSLVQILNVGVGHINQAIGSINGKDYSSAEAGIEAARDEFKHSDLPFLDLGKRQSSEQFQKLYQMAAVNRDLQDKFFNLSQILVSQGKGNDIEDFNKTIQKYNELSAAYNEKVGQINEILQHLASADR